MRKFTVFATSMFVVLSLAACSAQDKNSQPGSIDNHPSSLASAAQPTAESKSSASDEKSRKVVEILQNAKSTATPIMTTTSQRVHDEVLVPDFGGELYGMKIITWLALGADVDESSASVNDQGQFSVDLVADGQKIANVRGIVDGNVLRPTSLDSTTFGSEWYNSKSEVMSSWATS